MENLAESKLHSFQSPGSREAPSTFWMTWRGDHVTTDSSLWLQDRSTPTLSRPQWKTTAAATVFPPLLPTTFWSLPFFVCASMFLSHSFFSFSLLRLYMFHRPIPLHCLTNLSSGRKDWVKAREGKKLSAVVGIYVSWTNRLHMLVVMVQDVAHLIYSAFIFLFLYPPSLSPAVTIFCPVLYWSHSFTLWCSILCFSLMSQQAN